MEKETTNLKKNIGFVAALSTVMGTVIGAGVFFKAAVVAEATGTVSLSLLAWFLGGVITICAGLTAAELAAAIPETGGMMRYIEYTYGKKPGFLIGWAQTVIYFPANIAALAIIFSTQVINLFGLSSSLLMPIGVAVALFLTLTNLLGSKVSGHVQSFTTLFKLIPIILIIIFGLFAKSKVNVSLLPVTAGKNLGFANALGHGLLATMFAYDGWLHVGNIAGEMKNPKKDLPKAILLGLAGIMIVYMLINYVFLKSMPISQFIGNDNAASDVSAILFGGLGGKLVTIGILISVFGTINGYTMTGMRIPYAMALENTLPFSKQLKKLSKSGVPINCGILQVAIACIMIFLGAFNTLTDMLIFVIWIFYTMTFLATMILRKREPDMNRPYKTPLYPIVPIIAIIGGLFIVINTLFTQTVLALVGIALTAVGFPFYLYKEKQNKRMEE